VVTYDARQVFEGVNFFPMGNGAEIGGTVERGWWAVSRGALDQAIFLSTLPCLRCRESLSKTK
jgi:hypothetical protein